MGDKMTWKEFSQRDARVDLEEKVVSDVRDADIVFDGREDLSGFSFINCDMSGFHGFTREQFLSLSSISESVGPKIYLYGEEDIPECDGADLSNVMGMTPVLLKANAKKLAGAKFPHMRFAGTEDFAGIDLSDMDFSNVSGHRLVQLGMAKCICGAKIGRALLMNGDSLDGMDFTDCDMGEVIGAHGGFFNCDVCIDGAVLPPGNYHAYSMRGKSYIGTDFSRCRFLNWKQINEADDLSHCKMGFITIRRGDLSDDEGLLPIRPILTGTDLSKVINIGPEEAFALKARGAVNVRERELLPELDEIQKAERSRNSIEAYAIAQYICMNSNGKKAKVPSGMTALAHDIATFAKNKKLDPYAVARQVRGMDEDKAREKFDEIAFKNSRGIPMG